MNWNYTKQFWIKTIKKEKSRYNFRGEEFSISDWEDNINRSTIYQELDELARKLLKETASKSTFGVENLTLSEEKELLKCVAQDLTELEKELNFLKTQERTVFESAIETYKEDIKAFQNKIKAIIGDDLTNWESKIVKAGSSDKDIVDLQKKNHWFNYCQGQFRPTIKR